VTTPQAAPGWYPDPSGTGMQRYWDGTEWTMHHAPVVSQPPDVMVQAPNTEPAERRITIHYGFVVLAVFSLLGTLIPTAFWFSTANDPDTNNVGVGIGILWLLWGGMWTLIWAAFAIHHTLKGRKTS
jgi:hypothetical protein